MCQQCCMQWNILFVENGEDKKTWNDIQNSICYAEILLLINIMYNNGWNSMNFWETEREICSDSYAVELLSFYGNDVKSV